jgi:hypothetical protein
MAGPEYFGILTYLELNNQILYFLSTKAVVQKDVSQFIILALLLWYLQSLQGYQTTCNISSVHKYEDAVVYLDELRVIPKVQYLQPDVENVKSSIDM